MAALSLTTLLREALERKTPSSGHTWRTFTSAARGVTGVSDGDVGERQLRALVDKLVPGVDEASVRTLFLAHAGANGRVKLSAFGRAIMQQGEQPSSSIIDAHDARQKAAAEAQGAWTAERPYDARFAAHPWDARARVAAARQAEPWTTVAGKEESGAFASPHTSPIAPPPLHVAPPSQWPHAPDARTPAGSSVASLCGSAPRGGTFASQPRAATAEALSDHIVSAMGTLRAHLAELAERDVRAGADPLSAEDRHSLHRGQRDAARQQLVLVRALEGAAGASVDARHARATAAALALEPPALRRALCAIAAACGAPDGGAGASYCHPLVLRELWAVCAERTPPSELHAGADARIFSLVSFVYPPLALEPDTAIDGARSLFAASAALHRRPPADPSARVAFGGGRLANGPFDRESGRAGARYIPPPPAAALPSSVSYRHCVTTLRTPRDLTGEMVTRSARRPESELRLERVYGYNGASKWTRSANVFLVDAPADGAPLPAVPRGAAGERAADARIAYSAAGTVVLTDEATRAQAFFLGHDDDVSCLARHPSGRTMASGQGGRSGPFLKVWDTRSMAELATVGYTTRKKPVHDGAVDDTLEAVPFYQFSICAASFEPGAGDLLAAVGVDERYHELAVWEWRTGRLAGHTQTISADQPGVSAVHALEWVPIHAHAERAAAHVLVVLGAQPMPRFIFAEPGVAGGGQWLFARAQGAQPDAPKRPAARTPSGAAAARAATPRAGAPRAGAAAGVPERSQLCAAFGPARSAFEGLTLTGSGGGGLYAWDLTQLPPTRARAPAGAEPKPNAPRCVGFVLDAHGVGSAVTALAGTAAGFVSGGTDGQVHVWVLARARGADGVVHLIRARTFALGRTGSSAVMPPPAPAALDANAEAQRVARLALPGGARTPPAPRASAPPAHAGIRSLDARAALVPASDARGTGVVAVDKVVVGTIGGEVWSVTGERAERLVAAHARRVDALAPHPIRPIFATAAWDARVCVWSVERPAEPPRVWRLPGAATAVCFGLPDGGWLCAGLKNGGVLTATLADLAPLSEARAGDGTGAAVAVACAPSGGMLAVGASRVVDVFRVDASGRVQGLLARCRGSSSAIRTIDWFRSPPAPSATGASAAADARDAWAVVQASTAARELLFWHAPTGAQVRDPFERADARLDSWHTWTSPIGFAVMGIWADGANASGVNRVYRSSDGRLLVTSDDQSHLKLFNHPCIVEDAPFAGPYFAHASHVPAAVFLAGDAHVASVGGSDRTVMLWRVVPAAHAALAHGDGAAARAGGSSVLAPRPNDPPPPNKWMPAAYGKPRLTAHLYAHGGRQPHDAGGARPQLRAAWG
ncbi:hypothetical protein KFE25_005898 [Diacronema lutheri]|uniref:EML-like second beta-propeller domain-containing protein n=1 Tax=Diacronema lutheri TaxID=2081491 RepID=A0A8J5XK74_DIALT|nr:hypothetical protein KFE25_005898 [Diacronema lutheri]